MAEVEGFEQNAFRMRTKSVNRKITGRFLGRGFRREGTHVYSWPIHIDGKKHHNTVIILQLK